MERFLIFNIDKELFALPQSDVLKVGSITNRTKVPFANKIIPEVFNCQGVIIPLLKISEILGAPDVPVTNFVLVRGENYNLAFGVGEIAGAERAEEILGGETPRYVKNVVKIFNKRVYVIDKDKIFNEIQRNFKGGINV